MKGNKLLVVGFLLVCAVAIAWSLWKKAEKDRGDRSVAAETSPTPAPASGPQLEILFSSSDGKKDWAEDVTRAFNDKAVKVGNKTVHVSLKHIRSGESMQKILAGEEKPVIWGPASQSWIELINSTWKTRNGHDFVHEAKPTARTALVIAMWEPMARALGWPDKPVGWAEIMKVTADPKGWATYGHPEWGAFKFGHSHPDFSTSAMLSLVSLAYAETGKKQGLTSDDLKSPKVVKAMTALEQSIVHYGESSSWLTEKICTRGPAYLSAVTLYESSVVKANLKFTSKPFPLVAIYPKEGTFWEEHPAGIVDADWVTAEQKEAAQKYLDYILSAESQGKLVKTGFRPADKTSPLGEPIDKAHGADPTQNDGNALAAVSDEVFQRANALWHQVKKKSTVYLIIDTSGSMNGDPMNAAKKGAQNFVKKMEPEDELMVISFSTNVTPLGPPGKVKDVGEPMIQKIGGLFAEGNTALYDAINRGLTEVAKDKVNNKEPRLYGIVVLTDGKDTSSGMPKLDLLDKMPKGEDVDAIRVFTIAYGSEADADLLKNISDRSNAVAMKGDEKNIDKVYLSISSYF